MTTRNFNVKNGLTVGVANIDATTGNILTTGLANVGSLRVTGVSNLNAVGNVTITGGSSGQYLQTNGSGVLTWASVPTGTGISNGTSNISIPTANGSVNTSVGGTPNVLVVTSTGANVNGNIIATAYHIRSVGTSISAAGTNQGTATAIAKEMNVVSTVVSGAGVILPVATAGMVISITNTSANALLVYPATSAAINTGAANAAYTQPAGATLQYLAPTTTQWYTVGATFA